MNTSISIYFLHLPWAKTHIHILFSLFTELSTKYFGQETFVKVHASIAHKNGHLTYRVYRREKMYLRVRSLKLMGSFAGIYTDLPCQVEGIPLATACRNTEKYSA